MLEKLRQIWNHKDLRKRLLFVLGILILSRVLAHVPIPGVDVSQVKAFFDQNQIFGLVNLFSGGGLSNFSIAMMGLGPYITAAIIMQLLTMAVPKFENMQKEEGEEGRRKISQYTRLLTIPLSVVQAFGMIRLLQSQKIGGQSILGAFTLEQWLLTIIVLTAGTVLLMWLGELITENGVGNGISILIFASIVAGLPGLLGQSFAAALTGAQALKLVGLGVVVLLIIYGIVFVTEGVRNIPVTYARRMSGIRQTGDNTMNLPLKVNQAGVIPIIFAISVVLLPGIFSEFFKNSSNHTLANIATTVGNTFATTKPWYWVLYFVLVLGFTYFYTAVSFNPKTVAENIQKQGGFIPGIRPGTETVGYLKYILHRITLIGGIFLGIIAVLPYLAQIVVPDVKTLTIGGTSILIVISVVIETMKQINAQLLMRRYDRYRQL
jgi:preprotein translocase subunit SecY